MIKVKIFYDLKNQIVETIDYEGQQLIQGEHKVKTISIYFGDIGSNGNFIIDDTITKNFTGTAVIELPNGEKSNDFYLTPIDLHFELPVLEWMTSIAGTVKLTTKLKKSDVVVPLGLALLEIQEGISIASNTIEQAQYEALQFAITDINQKLSDSGTLESIENQNPHHSPLSFWTGTQSEYSAIGTKNPNTIYNVVESGSMEIAPVPIWSGTQEEYDAIEVKDDNTVYFVESDVKSYVDERLGDIASVLATVVEGV